MNFPYIEFQRQQAMPAIIEVWTQERAAAAGPRRMYGKFAEHLGHNIYHGMWAQVLDNPGFEPAERLARDKESVARHISHRAAPDPALPDDTAPFWQPVGEGGSALIPDGVDGTAQRITATQAGGGVQQAICLPLHRVGRYELTVWVRGDTAGPLRFDVQDEAGKTLGAAELRRVPKEWTKERLTLNVRRQGVPKGAPLRFSATLTAPGRVDLDQLFLFPSDNIHGFDPDVVAAVRQMKLPLLRFPGGNFVSGYHWQDGVGPVDQRPTKPNLAWNMPEYNHVGTDEHLAFCKAVGAEPLICVNAGDGTPEEAAAWVQYCNGGPETKWGALRARNGHPEPYHVKLWEVGNEIYGGWQIGHCSAEEYARRYVAFARAMLAADPTIELIACGENRRWNAPLVAQKEVPVRSLSVHTLPGAQIPADSDPEAVWWEAVAFPVAYGSELRGYCKQMSDAGLEPRLAITELQFFTNKRSLPNNTNLCEALFLAGVLHTAIRMGGQVELITHSALVNHAGGLGKVREVVFPNPVQFTSLLYSTTPGRWPVHVRVAGEGYDCPGKWLPAVRDVPVLDPLAMVDDSGRTLSLMVINRDPKRAQKASILLHGLSARKARARVVTGPDFMARNEWDRPDVVSVRSEALAAKGERLEYEFAPHSVTEIVIEGQ